jgi:broad specificity phosphatase PhoE
MRLNRFVLPVSLLGKISLVESFVFAVTKRTAAATHTQQQQQHRRMIMTMSPTPVDLYPYASRNEIASKFPNSHKVIHFVRHAEGTHNVHEDYWSDVHHDARLTDRGIQQCEDLADRNHKLHQSDFVVTSPMSRCIQTALLSFPTLTTFVAHESLRETVNYICDKRRLVTEIAEEFPKVDLSAVEHNEDPIWGAYVEKLGEEWEHIRESADLIQVAARGRTFFQFLQTSCPTDEVLVCTHSAFLRCILNWGYGVPMKPPQTIGGEAEDHPVVRYCGDKEWEDSMRASYKNCELRSMVVVFPDS